MSEDIYSLPKTRTEAKQLGLKYYFTGKPCKCGHVSKRYVGGNCWECLLIAGGDYRQQNREYFSEYHKSYHQQNRERISEYNKSYNERNKEQLSERRKSCYEQSKSQLSEYHKSYRFANPHIYNKCNSQRRAQKLNATPLWANDEYVVRFIYKLASVFSKCLNEKVEVDHIVPLKGKKVCGLHIAHNMQLLTESQNSQKSNKHE
ncbi:MAG: hypothetical protein ACYCZQ_03165 [Burkholderiales bacterium]